MDNKMTTLLFDLDGTLIDTNELIIQSFLHTFGQYYPNQYKREDILPFMGPSLSQTFGKMDPDRSEEMILTYQTYNKEKHDEYVTAFDGVLDTIAKLKKEGYKIAIVSSKRSEVVHMGLVLTGLDAYFETVVTVNDVEKEKPDPESIFKALEILGSTPEEAIMIGDNYHDIEAGKNAGIRTAGVAWSLKGKDFLQKYNPDYMLETMDDLLDILGVKNG